MNTDIVLSEQPQPLPAWRWILALVFAQFWLALIFDHQAGAVPAISALLLIGPWPPKAPPMTPTVMANSLLLVGSILLVLLLNPWLKDELVFRAIWFGATWLGCNALIISRWRKQLRATSAP